MATLNEVIESIDVAPDVVGSSVPETLDPVAVWPVGSKKVQLMMSGPVPQHDYRAYTWDGDNLTQIEYRRGGVGGVLVCTYSRTYEDNHIVTEQWEY